MTPLDARWSAAHARVRARVGTWVSEPVHVDVVIAAVVVAVTLVTTTAGPRGGRLGALALVAATVAGGVLVARRRYPFATLLASAVAAEVYLANHDGPHATVVLAAPLVALATVAELSPRRRAILVGGVIVLAVGVVHVWVKPAVLGAENLALAAFGGLAVAAGTASRHRRAYLAEVQARAERAEADRDAEANRRVTEERLRIARDLHDVLGHHLALIHIQARVAAHDLDGTDSPAARALDHVCSASKTALTELGDTIGLLRQPGEPVDPTLPVGNLETIDDLLAAYRTYGLDVTVQVTGAVRAVTAPVGLTAYRVIQESLTNVCKHAGPTTVTVAMAYRSEDLAVTVENRSTGRPASRVGAPRNGSGHGLVGMRERIAALGGQFTAGPVPGGCYRVTAHLPLAAAA